MSEQDREVAARYRVVKNDDEQYSIWRADREPPLGWTPVAMEGLEAECLAYIDEIWTDLRPLSLRRAMEQTERSGAADDRATGERVRVIEALDASE